MSLFRLRFVALVLTLIAATHVLLYIVSPSYKQRTSITKWMHSPSIDNVEYSYQRKCTPLDEDPALSRANASFVVLARNSELWPVMKSLRGLEDRFNKNYHYPIVFLNDVPFSQDFIDHTSALWSGEATYGLVPKEHWEVPSSIDDEKFAEGRKNLTSKNVIYGGSISYRQMCRFQSGFFYRHELLKPYRWYWRVEPNVQYFCDLDYDPFHFMQDNNKTYGFTLTLHEYMETVPTLWQHTQDFMKKYPHHIESDNAMEFISQDKGKTWNSAHFWSNFEIGDLDFYRGQAYSDYFDYLDQTGNFFYERWGDAPVHSLAACLFLKPEQIHFFDDIGYRHEPFQHCPNRPELRDKCWCDPNDSFDRHWYSFNVRWTTMMNRRHA